MNEAEEQKLITACLENKRTTIEEFISTGKNLNISHDGFSPVSASLVVSDDSRTYEEISVLKEESITLAKLLLENGCSPNRISSNEATSPLGQAIFQDDNKAVDLLFDYKVDPNQVVSEEQGYSPLSLAVNKGNAYCVKKLLENSADPNAKLKALANVKNEQVEVELPIICIAAQRNNLEVLELIASKCNINERSSSGHTALCFSLLDTSTNDRISYSTAASNILLDHGAHLDAHIENKNAGIAKDIFSLGFALDEIKDRDELYRREKLVLRLIDLGADPFSLSSVGNNGVKMAAAMGSAKLVEKFVNMGIDPNLPDIDNFTALHRGSWLKNKSNSERITKILLKHDFDIDSPDGNGNTAIESAFGWNNYGTALMMAKKGAEIPKYSGSTVERSSEKTGSPIPLWFVLFAHIRNQIDIENLISFIDLGLDLSIYNGLDTSNRKVVLAPYAVILSRMILQTQNKDHKGIPGTWEFKFKYQEDHENPYSVEKIDLEPLLNKLEEADRNSEKVDLKIHDKTYKISDLANVANKLKLIDEN